MPLLSRLLFAVIIQNLFLLGFNRTSFWAPPPTPPLDTHHNWFVSEWNKGLYPTPKWSRYRSTQSVCPISQMDALDLTMTKTLMDTTIDASIAPLDQVIPVCPRPDHINQWLQAYLYSLTTLGIDETI